MAKKTTKKAAKKRSKSPEKKIVVKKLSKKSGKKTREIFSAETGQLSPFRSDTNQTNILKRAGLAAGTNAIRESKAMGLTITFMENGVLYREHPNGTREIVHNSAKRINKRKIGGITITRGLVLHAKK